MIWFQAIYAIFCIYFAWENKKRISADKRIPHSLNGLVHILIWLEFHLLYHSHFVFILPFIARLFFDFSLSLFRGLDPGYVSDNPEAIADKAEKFVFGENGITPKILWLWVIIITLVIQFNV